MGAIYTGCPHIRGGGGGGEGESGKSGRPLEKKIIATIFVKFTVFAVF